MKKCRFTAFSRRIENHTGRGLRKVRGGQGFGAGDAEGRVGDFVEGGILAGVADGAFVAFDADDFFSITGKMQPDCSGAAVDVEEVVDGLRGFGCGLAKGVFENGVVEFFGLAGIDLEEGERRDDVFVVADAVGDDLGTMKELGVFGAVA